MLSSIDWSSSIRSQRMLDGFIRFPNIEANIRMSVIIDIRSIHFVKGVAKIQKVGWTIVPVFFEKRTNEKPLFYVRSGIYQVLKIYKCVGSCF